MTDALTTDSAALAESDPALPPFQPEAPAIVPREVLAGDELAPPRTLVDDVSSWVPEVKPIDIARYTSREFHDAEVEKMWSRVWQYACWTGDIPNPGDISELGRASCRESGFPSVTISVVADSLKK